MRPNKKYLGTLYSDTFVSRALGDDSSPRYLQFVTSPTGKIFPDGTFKIMSMFLKPFGDPSVQDDWEVHFSQPFKVRKRA